MDTGSATPRMVQEYVPGKQITLAHLIAHPVAGLGQKLGLPEEAADAIGILTITPSEAGHHRGGYRHEDGGCQHRLCRPLQRLASHYRGCRLRGGIPAGRAGTSLPKDGLYSDGDHPFLIWKEKKGSSSSAAPAVGKQR